MKQDREVLTKIKDVHKKKIDMAFFFWLSTAWLSGIWVKEVVVVNILSDFWQDIYLTVERD